MFDEIPLETKTNEYICNPTTESHYLLDSGDVIYIDFGGLEIFSNDYSINRNGYLELPEIDKINARKKTLKELKKILLQKYKEYIIEPNIEMKIIKYREIKVVVNGEVKQPGLYSFEEVNQEVNQTDFSTSNISNINNKTLSKFPRVFDAIRLTKGITNNADLSKIQIIRDNSDSNGGGKISTNLNLLSLLQDGNQNVNIKLMDGDLITVPRSEKIIKEQILSLNKSNITPDQITVYISGNIVSPGEYNLKQGTTLVQGIYKAGGEKSFTGKVKHLRFNDIGSVKSTTLSFDIPSRAKSQNNIILLDGDIIHVNRNIIGKSTNIIGNIAGPIIQTNVLFNLFQ